MSSLSEKCDSAEGRLSDALRELDTLQSHYDERGRENDDARAHAHEAKQGWEEEKRVREKRCVAGKAILPESGCCCSKFFPVFAGRPNCPKFLPSCLL